MHGQRELAKDEAHTRAIVVLDFSERRRQKTARLALVVAKFFQGHARIVGTVHMGRLCAWFALHNFERSAGRFCAIQKQGPDGAEQDNSTDDYERKIASHILDCYDSSKGAPSVAVRGFRPLKQPMATMTERVRVRPAERRQKSQKACRTKACT